MRAVAIAVALALVPALADAQAQALEAARQAGKRAEGSAAARAAAADAQLRQDGAAPEDPAEAAIDLGPAARRLEGGAPEGNGAAAPAGAPVTAPETYTVRPGDTLWDLSGRFLNNPWYWPKVWSYNPAITNPHWIEPGNVVRLVPGAEGGPARVEPAAAPQEAAEALPEDAQAPRELEALSRADMKKPQDFGDDDAVAVTGPYKIGYVAPRTVKARRDTFVTARELAEAGVVQAAFEDKLLLTIHDRLYARFKPEAAPRVGQSYSLYRTVRAVTHPTTGERLGFQTQLVGTARAVASDDRATTMVVTEATEPIERGDLLAPQAERLSKPVARRPNQRRVQGLIVATERQGAWLAAENHLVFVNRGRADGVEEGNVFTVVRSGDPYGKPLKLDDLALPADPGLPREDIGELVVVDAKESFSTALVVRSLRELFHGDLVEMRVAGAAGP